MIKTYDILSLTKKGEVEMSEDAETREISDICSALCLPNQERAYDVACALKFAEGKAGEDAGCTGVSMGVTETEVSRGKI
jgi:hypothetical protein